MQATIQHLDNPRVEKETHYYNAAHSKLIDLGLQPHFLSDTLIDSVKHIIYAHRDQVRPELVLQSVNWRQTSSPLSHTPS